MDEPVAGARISRLQMARSSDDEKPLLVLVSNPAVNERADFDELARWAMEAEPGIDACVIDDDPSALSGASAERPLLVFSPGPLRHISLRRGTVLTGRWLPKSVECERLLRVGLPVPSFAKLSPGSVPPSDDLGRYVVVKPELGARGADVRVVRADRLAWGPPKTRLAKMLGGPLASFIAQRFVHTGLWPRSHRVVTLFGEVLWSVVVEASHTRRALASTDGFSAGRGGSGVSVVSSGRGCSFQLSAEPDVIELAKRAHHVFEELPVLGVDIVRDSVTGQLWILEVNSAGMTWHFSSPGGRKMQSDFGISLEAQFDGRRRAARLLARRTLVGAT
jgi:hypothetical protein